jgi:hypothetical protein
LKFARTVSGMCVLPKQKQNPMASMQNQSVNQYLLYITALCI